MVKLTPTGVKINTKLVWISPQHGGVEFNTGVFAVWVYFCGWGVCEGVGIYGLDVLEGWEGGRSETTPLYHICYIKLISS